MTEWVYGYCKNFRKATRHYNMKKGIDRVLQSLHNVADALAQNGVEVIRRKVEIVLYDSKVKHGD